MPINLWLLTASKYVCFKWRSHELLGVALPEDIFI